MAHVFVCGNPALDLLGTLKWRRSPSPEELLRTPGDLAAWIEESGLVTTVPRVTATDLRAVLDLREATYRCVTAARRRRRPTSRDLDVLNRAAARAPLIERLTGDGVEVAGTVGALASTLARSAMHALTVDADALKECAEPSCTRVFVDRSRGRRRSWCGMNECGVRVKVAAFRARRRASADPAAR